MLINGVLYNRVSTDDQDAAAGLVELRAAAAARGIHVVMEVEETISGARADRPGLRRVLEAARRGEVKVVLVTALDRFGRSALDLHVHVQELLNAGVRFVALRQGLDLVPGGDAVGQLILAVLAGVAQFERALIRERTRLGLAAARRRGSRLGRKPAYPGVRADQVLELRAAGRSWPALAGELGCSVAAARRLADGAKSTSPPAGNGGLVAGAEVPETAAAA